MAYVHSIATSSIFTFSAKIFSDFGTHFTDAMSAFLHSLPALAEKVEYEHANGQRTVVVTLNFVQDAFQALCNLAGQQDWEHVQHATECFNEAVEVIKAKAENGDYYAYEQEMEREANEAEVYDDGLDLLPYEEARAQAKAEAEHILTHAEWLATMTPEQIQEMWENYVHEAWCEGASTAQARDYADAKMRGEVVPLPVLTINVDEPYAPATEADRTYGYYTAEELETERLKQRDRSYDQLCYLAVCVYGSSWDLLSEDCKSELKSLVTNAAAFFKS